ncbi:MAG: metal ABC transporter ATP-binding protein [Chloroflexi bacterium]|nr:metal ABC transporter ATP-binding protein [Chloroflexota bacterium]
MAEAAVSFQHVSFRYDGAWVIEDLSLEVHQGDFLALVGPNGGGKTTLLKLALGLLRPQQGEIKLFGADAESFRWWSKVGYVPQRASGFEAQFPGTVGEVVAQGEYRHPSPLGFFRRKLSASVERALEEVELWESRGERVSTLSTGQQQRVLIARALVRHPQLLLLDEPTSGVDATAQESFYALLRKLHREQGLTIFLVSHDIGVVMKEANRIACVNRKLTFHGPPAAFPSDELSRLYGVPVDLLTHEHE